MFDCDICKKPFASMNALNGHKKIHTEMYENTNLAISIKMSKIGAERSMVARKKYELNAKSCMGCKLIITYEKFLNNRVAKFCSSSCAATFNNKNRKVSDEAKKAISDGLLKFSQTKPVGPLEDILKRKGRRSLEFFKKSVDGPFSKVFHCQCKHCGASYFSSSIRKYCLNHSSLYLDEGRNKFEFTFNPFNFPDIFSKSDLENLKSLGFWSPKNKNGLTRDHKLSVNNAIRNDLDSFYVKHPLNCELMTWQENNEKKTKSSLNYEDLKLMVDKYELGKADSRGNKGDVA